MIEIVFDGIGSLNSHPCACCMCEPKTGTGGDNTAKVSEALPLIF